MVIIYACVLLLLSLYSYSLIDLNLTLINHPLWKIFREQIITIGYFRRDISWYIYLLLIIILFAFFFYFVKNHKKYNPFIIALVIASICLFSYPFLSHDFFNYLFDAKILTYYGKNPYQYTALDFPQDNWTRFMHWTHRTYPYGPSFLLLTIVPSFLSFGKFILSYFFFKFTFLIFYLSAVFLLIKIKKKWAMAFATHPLIIMEGIISLHNDIVATALAIMGIVFLLKRSSLWGRTLLLTSGGIKYLTLPLLFLKSKNKHIYNIGIGIIVVIVLLYLTFFSEIQPWYFLILFALMPFYFPYLMVLSPFFFGLLISYYPYIRLGGWDTAEKVHLKHVIILVFFVANLVYILLLKAMKKKDIFTV